jgi:ADP-ribosylglycohydrolase
MKIVPVVCKFAGHVDLKEKVKTAILTHQNNPMAIKFGIAAARILEAVVLGAPSLAEALATVESNLVQDLGDDAAKEVQAAIDIAKAAAATNQSVSDVLLELSHEMMKDQPESPFYDLAARSCALPGSFIGPLVQLYRTPPVDYVAGLRENILASGDTCSRAVFLGAVLGAMTPDGAGVPVSWLDRLDTKVRSHVDGLSQKISAAS